MPLSSPPATRQSFGCSRSSLVLEVFREPADYLRLPVGNGAVWAEVSLGAGRDWFRDLSDLFQLLEVELGSNPGRSFG